jgi:hypothetical protein
LRFGVEAVFLPPRRPQRQGSVENFNGWFQPLLFARHFTRPGDLTRELRRLEVTVNTQHAHQRLGGLTPEQYRRRHQLQKLPSQFAVPLDRLPLAAGRVTFIRQVSRQGSISLLSQKFKVGKRLRGRYVKAVLDPQGGWLTVYLNGRVFKRWDYKLLNK